MSETPFLQSKKFIWLTVGLLSLILLLTVFQLGMYVGYRKASFAFRWADAYQRNFGGPSQGFWQEFRGQDFVSGHGTAGKIIRIDGSTLVVKGRDAVEKLIILDDDEAIVRRGNATVSTDTLKINDNVVIIGAPNEDGSVQAKMIRLFLEDGPRPSFPPNFKTRF